MLKYAEPARPLGLVWAARFAADRSFEKLPKGSGYGRIIVDSADLSEIPHDVRRSRHILVVRMQLDLKSLEAARIRAGVIV